MPFIANYLDTRGVVKQGLSEADIEEALNSREGLLWIDIHETTAADGEFLKRVFPFHSLAVEDCVESSVNTPKVDDFEDHLFIVLHGIDYAAEEDVLQTTELDIFLGSNYVVSNHNRFLYSVEAVKRLAALDGRPLRRGSEFLAHSLIDALVTNITPAIDRLGERVDDVEEVVFRSTHQSTMEAILLLKRSSLRLRRAMVPQREVLNRLGRGEFLQIGDEARIFYRDIYDHMVRIEGLVEGLRERTDTVLATYMSAVAQQQNETMKTLSLIAAIFLPLSLLAGVYGMNFENMPELSLWWGYYGVLGAMVVAAVGTAWWFWARKWIAVGRRRMERFIPTAVDPEKLIGYVTRWPNEHVARIPGLNVAMGVTAYGLSSSARTAATAANLGRLAASDIAGRVSQAVTTAANQVGDLGGLGESQLADIARNATRGALHAVDGVTGDVGSLAKGAVLGTISALGKTITNPREVLRGVGYGTVQGASETGADLARTTAQAIEGARGTARELGLPEEEAAEQAAQGMLAAAASMGPEALAQVRQGLATEGLPPDLPPAQAQNLNTGDQDNRPGDGD